MQKLHSILTEPLTITFHFQHIALVLLVGLVVFLLGYFCGVNRTLKRKMSRFEFEET